MTHLFFFFVGTINCWYFLFFFVGGPICLSRALFPYKDKEMFFGLDKYGTGFKFGIDQRHSMMQKMNAHRNVLFSKTQLCFFLICIFIFILYNFKNHFHLVCKENLLLLNVETCPSISLSFLALLLKWQLTQSLI